MQRPGRVSRRRVLVSIGAATTLLHSAVAAATEERRKLTPEEAGYKLSPDGALICAACAYFVAPRYCSIMYGEVSPEGTCRYFKGVE